MQAAGATIFGAAMPHVAGEIIQRAAQGGLVTRDFGRVVDAGGPENPPQERRIRPGLEAEG